MFIEFYPLFLNLKNAIRPKKLTSGKQQHSAIGRKWERLPSFITFEPIFFFLHP